MVDELFLDLIKAHSTVIFTGRESGVVSVHANSNQHLLMLVMQLEILGSAILQQ